jgi:hypothetical protein
MLLGIVVVLLLVGGIVLAYRAGWISVPDLSATSEQTATPQKKEPNQLDQDKGTSAKGNTGKVEGGTDKVDPKTDKVDPKTDKVDPKTEKVDPKPEKVDPKPPVEKKREFKGTEHVLSAIRDHLQKLPKEDRRFQRYFTLTNLHNDKAVSNKQLEEYRAALPLLLRHLRPDLEKAPKVKAIDAEKTILCLDMRHAGWDEPAEAGQPVIWRTILKYYPYALNYGGAKDEEVSDAARKIARLSGGGEDLPLFVRLDWFLAAVRQQALREQLGSEEAGSLPAAVTDLAKRYDQPVSAEQAARELGLEDDEDLLKIAADSPVLRERGLAPLLSGLEMDRARWANPKDGTSLYQQVARRLDLGTPLSVLR